MSRTLGLVVTDSRETDSPSSLLEELLDLVPAELLAESGEVFYSGVTSFERPSLMYLLGFNPGGDPAKVELERYTVAADLEASRSPLRRDWSAFEDDWRDFGSGALAFQRRVRHLIEVCGIDSPRKVPTSNAIFVRSSRVETLDARRTKKLLEDCWAIHAKVISALDVRVVVCLGQATGQWVRAQLGVKDEPALDTFTEVNARRWRSLTHRDSDGIQVVTLAHPSVADWTNPRTDPTGLVVRALQRAAL